jgi:uncharacterized protein
MMIPSKLSLLPGRFAIARLDPGEAVPAWAWVGAFASVSRTSRELSIVCAEDGVPPEVVAERGWRAFEVSGPMDLSTVGVLASIAQPLAEAGIALFAISTFDTDYVLVSGETAGEAAIALRDAGHEVGGA